MTCPECNGTGVFDRIDYDEIPCPACDGTGEIEVCAVCGIRAKTHYADREDMPSCGQPACELRMQAMLDYHDDVGNR